MKLINSPGFTRIAPIVVASLGLFAASASALEKASVFLVGKAFGNGKNLTANSLTQPVKQTIARSKIYTYNFQGTVGGTGGLAFVKPGTTLGSFLDLIATDSSKLLSGSVENPSGTLPFTIIKNQVISGVEDIPGVGKVSIRVTLNIEILANGAVAVNVSNVRIKKPTGLIPGSIKFGPGSKISVNTAPIVRIKLVTINVDENDPTGNVVVEVIRGGGYKLAPAKVNYSTSDDTAIAGKDYTTIINGTVALAAGQVTNTFSIPIINNTDVDGFRRFKVTLSTIPEYKTSLGLQTTATIGINNDDQ